ncbi:hypothetical protein V1507DRAFT_468700 [Lipomyces tetrasporus]
MAISSCRRYRVQPYAQTQLQPGALSIAAGAHEGAQLTPPLQNGLVDPLWPYGESGLAAGGEDWALQGTDMAYFENLMRGAGDYGVYWTVEASSR